MCVGFPNFTDVTDSLLNVGMQRTSSDYIIEPYVSRAIGFVRAP